MNVVREIKRYLGFESVEEKIQRLEEIKKSFEESDQQLDELARDFYIEKSMYEARMQDPENYTIQSKIQVKFDIFVKGHKDSIRKAKKQYDSLKKEKEKLEKDEIIKGSILGEFGDQCIATIESALKNKKETAYEKIKKAYQNGKISLDSFNTIIKGLTKEEKTKYADFLLFNEEGKLLLLKRSSWEDDNAGAWVVPGGHVDPGEDFETAAIRELQEESGYNVTDPQNVGSYEDEKCHIEYFQAYINTKEKPLLLQFAEVRDYKWIPVDEVKDETMVFNMRDNVMKILGVESNLRHKTIIRKAILEGIIPVELISKALNKDYTKLLLKMKERRGELTKDDFLEVWKIFNTSKNNEGVEEFNEYQNHYKLKDLPFWPEGLDLENCEVVYIDKEKVTVIAGGDWQDGKYVTIGLADSSNRGFLALEVISVSDEKPKGQTARERQKFRKENGLNKSEEIDLEKGGLKNSVEEGRFELPKGHEPFIQVAEGGSNCSNCEYVNLKEGTCGNENFIKWNKGSNKLPTPLKNYCSDWYEPQKDTLRKAYLAGLISDELIEKAWKKQPIGTITTRRDGKRYKKVSETGNMDQDWELVTKDKVESGKPGSEGNKGSQEVKGGNQQFSKKELEIHAKNASESTLQAAIKESPDEEVRKIAHKELGRRETEEKVPEKDEKKLNEKEDQVSPQDKFAKETGKDYIKESIENLPSLYYGKYDLKSGELKNVSLDKLKPTQEGEDRKNASSEAEAEVMRQFLNDELEPNDVRAEDFYPILVDADTMEILDGNHRFSAYEILGLNKVNVVMLKPKKDEKSEESVEDLKKQYEEAMSSDDFEKLNEIGRKLAARANKGKSQEIDQSKYKDDRFTQSFSDEETKALDTYASGKYKEINSQMREGKLSEENKKIVDLILSAMDKNKTKEDVVVYRGQGNDHDKNNKAFTSTSTNEKTASNFARGKDAKVEKIIVPKGTPVAYMGGAERELVLPPNWDQKEEQIKKGYEHYL